MADISFVLEIETDSNQNSLQKLLNRYEDKDTKITNITHTTPHYFKNFKLVDLSDDDMQQCVHNTIITKIQNG